MAESQQPLAVRVYSGGLKVQRIQTSNTSSFLLLSVPFYLLDRLKSIVGEMIWNYWKEFAEMQDEFELEFALSQIFSKKQKELFLKNLKVEN